MQPSVLRFSSSPTTAQRTPVRLREHVILYVPGASRVIKTSEHTSAWSGFRSYLKEILDLDPRGTSTVDSAKPRRLYDLASDLQVDQPTFAQYAADSLGVPVTSSIDPGDVAPWILPDSFCRANLVVPTRLEDGGHGAIVSNPFDWELMETLRKVLWKKQRPRVVVANPDVIRGFFARADRREATPAEQLVEETAPLGLDADLPGLEGAEPGEPHGQVIALANEILRGAVTERASDVHIEPKRENAVVRFRVDGDLKEVLQISTDQARRLVARFKALGELDVAEKRKPQDGALEAIIHGCQFRLRVATTRTPHGESLVIRLIEPHSTPQVSKSSACRRIRREPSATSWPEQRD